MSPQEGPCQEVGNWAALVLGGSVLLCVASNAICLLASPPPRPPTTSRSVRYQAPRSRSPPRKLTWDAASDRGGGHPAKRVCSTCRCSSQPGRRRAEQQQQQQHRPKATATGSARTRRSPEAYGSYWLGPPVAVLEKRAAATTTTRTPPRPPSRRPRSRSASPREGSRPRGHVLILRAQPKKGQQQQQQQQQQRQRRPRTPTPPGAPPRGHIIYARQAGFSA